MKEGLRAAAERRVQEVYERPECGPIRRILFALGAAVCALMALAAFDIAITPQLVSEAKAGAFLLCIALLVPTYILTYRALTGRR